MIGEVKSQPIKSLEQIEQIEEYLKERSLRNHLIFKLGVSTGINIVSLLALNVQDVKGKVYIEAGSTTTFRRIPIDSELQQLIKEYVKGKKLDSYLFENKKYLNKPLNSIHIMAVFRKVYKALGMEGTYSLRKTFGYWHYKHHQNEKVLKEILGQTKLIDSLVYIGWRDN